MTVEIPNLIPEGLPEGVKAVRLDQYCRVRLTDAGIGYYFGFFTDRYVPAPPYERKEGQVRFPLRQILEIFGPRLKMHESTPFEESTITIEANEGEQLQTKFNLNDEVYIPITPEVYRKLVQNGLSRPKEYERKYFVMQFYQFANILGPELSKNENAGLIKDDTFYVRPHYLA